MEVMGMPTTPLDQMPDPEVLGDPLDLSRPELAPLMRRYSSVASEPPPSLLRQLTALIVGSSESDGRAVKVELENQGWSVMQCLGPGKCEVPRPAREALRSQAIRRRRVCLL
jgi:hypothetical protein